MSMCSSGLFDAHFTRFKNTLSSSYVLMTAKHFMALNNL